MTTVAQLEKKIGKLSGTWSTLYDQLKELKIARTAKAAELDAAVIAGADRAAKDALRGEIQELDDQIQLAAHTSGEAKTQRADTERELAAMRERQMQKVAEESAAALHAAHAAIKARVKTVAVEFRDLLRDLRVKGASANQAHHALSAARGLKLDHTGQPHRADTMVGADTILRLLTNERGVIDR